MKKQIVKSVALGLSVLPLGLLSACGGGQLDFKSNVNVNNAGAYSSSNIEALENMCYTSDGEIKTDSLTGYRMKVEYSMSVEDYGTMNFNMAGIFKIGISEDEELSSFEMALKLNMEMGDEKVNETIYVPNDGYMYVGMNATGDSSEMNGKYKMEYDEDMLDNFLNGMGDILSMGADLEELFDAIDEAEDVQIEKAESGSKTNFKIVVPFGDDTNATYYILFENGNVVGCQYEMPVEGSTMKVVIEPFDGDIKYPNLNSYSAEFPLFAQ